MQNNLHPSIKTAKQVGLSDAVLLTADPSTDRVTEDSFLDNLDERFRSDTIYTYIGDVVVSVNPFKPMQGLYNQAAVNMYKGKYYYEVPPHIYSISDDAHRDMSNHNRDQCIIISGESGAGKTEASKHIMQYIAAISHSSKEIDKVKDNLLRSNPILEAFGNAKTNRNFNSSRFGKYMDIQFNSINDPIGGRIRNYLLEKSRVVHLAKNERSFHIMYYLLESKLDYLQLSGNAEDYFYLNQSGCYKVGAINDRKEYEVLLAAMKAIGFSQNEITDIFKIIAGILHVGNLEFTNQADKTTLKHSKHLKLAADLLGTTTDNLQSSFLVRTVNSGREQVQSLNSVEQAVYTRDSLAKALYGRLFDYIVSRVNQSVHCDQKTDIKSIGVLDIYGFEVFETGNSFEQFCINYCNEKLQQLFIEMTLKREQEDYQAEGIEWRFVEYFNNQVIIDLIEGPKNGMISLLDEECLRPGDVSDKHFLTKMNERYGANSGGKSGNSKNDGNGASKYFESRESSKNDKSIGYEQFRLKHYAGNVSYDINGFMDKNMDKVSRDVKALLADSRNTVISKIFPADEVRDMKLTTTTITLFKSSLNELVNTLRSKHPHYIRCIKSNDKQIANQFDRELVRHQVRYLALLENVRVRRAGFVFRQPYEMFLSRFRLLSPRIWPINKGSPREGTEILMKHMQVPADGYRLGVSKVFIRKPSTLFAMEELRDQKLPVVATMIQRLFRGYLARKQYARLYASKKILMFYRRNRFVRYLRELNKTFGGVEKRQDLGKRLEWPKVRSRAVTQGAYFIYKIWKYWRARKIINSYSPGQRYKIEIALAAMKSLDNKQAVNPLRRFEFEYLGREDEKSKQRYEQFKQTLLPQERILFSDVVQKCSRKLVGAKRYLIITDKSIRLLHPDYSNTKHPRPLSGLERISVTSKKDSFIVLHMQTDGDIILDMGQSTARDGEKVSELVGVLTVNLRNISKTKDLAVNVCDTTISAQTANKKTISVKTEKGLAKADGSAIFKSSSTYLTARYADI